MKDIVKESCISHRALDLAVPHVGNVAQKEVISQMVQYAQSKGIALNVVPIP